MTKYAFPRRSLQNTVNGLPIPEHLGEPGMTIREWLLGRCFEGFAASLVGLEEPLTVAQVEEIVDTCVGLVDLSRSRLGAS